MVNFTWVNICSQGTHSSTILQFLLNRGGGIVSLSVRPTIGRLGVQIPVATYLTLLIWFCFKEAVFRKVLDTPIFERQNLEKLHFASFKIKLFAYFQQYMAIQTKILRIKIKYKFKFYFLRQWSTLFQRFFVQHLKVNLTLCVQQFLCMLQDYRLLDIWNSNWSSNLKCPLYWSASTLLLWWSLVIKFQIRLATIVWPKHEF